MKKLLSILKSAFTLDSDRASNDEIRETIVVKYKT